MKKFKFDDQYKLIDTSKCFNFIEHGDFAIGVILLGVKKPKYFG